jgi:hypothetical protein
MLICRYAGTELKDQHKGVRLYGEQDKDLIFMVARTIRRCDFLPGCKPDFHNTDVHILTEATRHCVLKQGRQ